MHYNGKHQDLLERLYLVAHARRDAIDISRRERKQELARHLEEMSQIRTRQDSMNATLAAHLEEAAQKKIPQSILAEVVGLSRTRLHQIRRTAS